MVNDYNGLLSVPNTPPMRRSHTSFRFSFGGRSICAPAFQPPYLAPASGFFFLPRAQWQPLGVPEDRLGEAISPPPFSFFLLWHVMAAVLIGSQQPADGSISFLISSIRMFSLIPLDSAIAYQRVAGLH